jgi:thiamine-phosphate diphosphorylase/hydroxyethylthiazole kinase
MGTVLWHEVDYSLYLVTDSNLLSPSATSFEDHVEQLILGGVTVVQLREKTLSTADFVQRGRLLLEITRRHGIPLIINDRVDVALAIDADGVHVGQDDMGFPQCPFRTSDSCQTLSQSDASSVTKKSSA